MNLEDLRTIQGDERGADSPQALPDSFYRDVAAYVEELREERSHLVEESGDPFGSERVRKLTDEIETAEEVAEAIYERRVGKVVKQASLAAMGLPAEEEGLTTEETALFEDLVARIEANRETVLATVAGGAVSKDDPPESTTAGTAAPTDAQSETDDETPQPPPEADPASSDSDADEAAPDDTVDRVTVRITSDVGEIFGVDERAYDLNADDVVTLPAANAAPLVDSDAAERLE